jgi:hypothetical protein
VTHATFQRTAARHVTSQLNVSSVCSATSTALYPAVRTFLGAFAMVGLESSPLLGNLRGPQQTTNKGAKPYVIVASIVVMMSLFGTLFFARGGSQLSPLSDYSLGAEDAQPFVNVLGVEQGQCDFVTCDVTDEGPSNAHMYSFVDDCRGGGAGCVGTTGGCRHCHVGEVTREHHPDFPVCPPCVCEHHGLSTEGCAGGALPEPGTDPVETSDPVEATQTEAPPSPSPPPSPFPPPNPCRRSVTVARSDAVGAGWGMNLRFSCLGTSPIDIGQGKAGSTETTVFVDNINPDACPVRSVAPECTLHVGRTVCLTCVESTTDDDRGLKSLPAHPATLVYVCIQTQNECIDPLTHKRGIIVHYSLCTPLIRTLTLTCTASLRPVSIRITGTVQKQTATRSASRYPPAARVAAP